ncbi:MAG: magnesium transporter, partial [Phycisphaerales bacterium]|nr:magnesium transporter [Phycisphaerales bacterium]
MKNPLLTPEIREWIESGDVEGMAGFAADVHPQTVADCLSDLEDGEIWRFLEAVPPVVRGRIFSRFEMDDQVRHLASRPPAEMAELLEHMEPDDRADLVKQAPEEVTGEILPLVAKAERENIRKLASYREQTAGAIMNTDYATLRPETSVAEALTALRREAPRTETIYVIYAVDEGRRLVGTVSLRDLILARPGQRVADIMQTDVVRMGVDADQEEVARELERYDLLAIPVIDGSGVLVGIVTADDVADVARQEATEDIQKLGGVQALEGSYLAIGFWSLFAKRAPWLCVLFLGQMLTATAMDAFEAQLQQAIVLALFIPLIISSGGNSGSQAATLIIRAMAVGDVQMSDWWKVLRREVLCAAALGGLLGAVG